MNTRIMISLISAEPIIKGAYTRRVERKRGAALRSGAARGKRLAPSELADLARELAGMVGGNGRLAIETIAADDIDRTLEHEPGRRMTPASNTDSPGAKSRAGPLAKRLAVSTWPGSSTGNNW